MKYKSNETDNERLINHMKQWIEENNKDALRLAYRWLDMYKEIKNTTEWKEFVIWSRKFHLDRDFK